jgi:hypothetical protein
MPQFPNRIPLTSLLQRRTPSWRQHRVFEGVGRAPRDHNDKCYDELAQEESSG